MGARNRVGIGVSSLPARLHTLGWLNWFPGIDFWAPSRFKNLCISYMNSFCLWGSCPLVNKGCCQGKFSASFNIMNRGLQGDVYLSWPAAPLEYEPKCRGRRGGRLRGLGHHVHITWHGAQINFGDQTPYLTYVINSLLSIFENM